MESCYTYHSLCPFIDDFHETVFEWRNEFIMSHRVRVLNCLDTFRNSINYVESLRTAVSSPSTKTRANIPAGSFPEFPERIPSFRQR